MTLNEIIMQLVLLEEHPAMPKGFQPTFQKVIEVISEMPEIIRCKDCVHNDGGNPISDGRYWCVIHNSYMYYCSDGELRGDSDENSIQI